MGSTVFPAASSGLVPKYQEFTSGTTSWTAPAGVTQVECLLVAGGGGSGGAGTASAVPGAGGGGQVVKQFLTVVPGTSYSVVIGAGGAGGAGAATGSSGSNGTNSSFGSLLTCGGGGGGCGSGTPTAGLNGTAGTNALTVGGDGAATGGWQGGKGLGGAGGGVKSTNGFSFGGAGGGAGGHAAMQGDATNYLIMAGPGLYGFGFGGSSIQYGYATASYASPSNTGNGAKAPGGTSLVGAAGGSGYCLITWWQ